jgi:hypothetical protein
VVEPKHLLLLLLLLLLFPLHQRVNHHGQEKLSNHQQMRRKVPLKKIPVQQQVKLNLHPHQNGLNVKQQQLLKMLYKLAMKQFQQKVKDRSCSN